MLQIDKKGMRNATIAATLLLIAYVLRLLSYDIENIFMRIYGGSISESYIRFWEKFGFVLRTAIYTGVIAAWGCSVHYRVIHPRVKRLFGAIALLMLFWLLLRTIKFLPPDSVDLVRFLWYLYYIPMLFIPLLAFFISLWLGRPEDYRLPGWTRWLYVVTAALTALVLSNDFHQLVFAFPADAPAHSDANNSYAILFPLVFGWRIAGLVLTMVVIFARSRVPQSGKRLILPLIPSALLLVYGVIYMARLPMVYVIFDELMVTESLFVITILESCMQCGLIQTNTHYAELFKILGSPSAIVDEDHLPVYASDAFQPISAEQMAAADSSAVELREGLLLKSMPVKGGHILWTEDVSEFVELKTKLDAMAQELAEEQDLLQAEIEMKEKQAVIDTRNLLYDSVARELSQQFREIDSLVSAGYQSGEAGELAMRRMCVLGAYVKRRCNLLFLSEEREEISSDELAHCLRESADYIRFYGADCMLNVACSRPIPAGYAKLLYDLFERVVETVLETLSAMLIYLEPGEDGAVLNIQSECLAEAVDLSDWEEKLRCGNGAASCVREEGALYVRLCLRWGDGGSREGGEALRGGAEGIVTAQTGGHIAGEVLP